MTIFILIIGIPSLAIAAAIAIGALRKKKGVTKYLQLVGGSLFFVGCLGFFGTGFLSKLQLPTSFEWPIGWADQVIPWADGSMLALHTPSGRAQVYDENQDFVRGWSIDASGGLFKGKALENGSIEIWTSRGQERFVFTVDGSVIEQGTYAPASYDDFDVHVESGSVPIFFPLWIFANPFIAFGVGALGMTLIFEAARLETKESNQTG